MCRVSFEIVIFTVNIWAKNIWNFFIDSIHGWLSCKHNNQWYNEYDWLWTTHAPFNGPFLLNHPRALQCPLLFEYNKTETIMVTRSFISWFISVLRTEVKFTRERISFHLFRATATSNLIRGLGVWFLPGVKFVVLGTPHCCFYCFILTPRQLYILVTGSCCTFSCWLFAYTLIINFGNYLGYFNTEKSWKTLFVWISLLLGHCLVLENVAYILDCKISLRNKLVNASKYIS